MHGERTLYDSEWVSLRLVDVEPPGADRFEHHVVRVPRDAAGAVVLDPQRGVLLLWRHRFITDTWGYEVPSGGVDVGESAAAAAAREVLEETGWRPGPLSPLSSYNASNGLSDQRLHLFLAHGAVYEGEPVDAHEAERIEWVPLADIPQLIRTGKVPDGLSQMGLLYVLAPELSGTTSKLRP